MPRLRLSALAIDKLTPPQSGRLELRDSEVPGLTLRVSPSGVRSWSLTYSYKGVLRRLTLGQYPGVSLKLARERGRDARASIQRGEDPVQSKKDEEREALLNGFTSCAEDYVAKYAKVHQRTWKETERLLKRFAIKEWGDRPVKEIRRRDVVDLLDSVATETPYQANQLRAHLSRMFNWLLEREIVEANPVTGVAPRVKIKPRERILSDVEIAALWKATGRMGGAFGAALRFLLLTGVRRDEASRLRWDELVGDWAAMPASRMKNNRDFRLPLSGAVKAIISSRPRLTYVEGGEVKTCPWVFTTNGKSPLSGWMQAKYKVDKLVSEELGQQITAWRLHDLRRTLGSGLARLGYSIEVRKRVLAHVPRASDPTTATYTWHNFDDEARQAVTAWAAQIAKVTSGLEVVQPAHPAA